MDTEVDKRLDAIGTEEATALKGKAAIANARLAYALYEEAFACDRWQALAGQGANKQRPLWASTGVKDPAYPDTMYVDRAGRRRHREHHAGEDHGRRSPTTVRCTATPSPARDGRAQQVLDELAAVGHRPTTTWSRCSRTRAWRSSRRLARAGRDRPAALDDANKGKDSLRATQTRQVTDDTVA